MVSIHSEDDETKQSLLERLILLDERVRRLEQKDESLSVAGNLVFSVLKII